MRTALPSGYEVAALAGRAAPVVFWGLGPGWIADPPRCGALADPVADAATTRGWSASGAGGIVYAVVTGSPTATLDPSLIDECGQWTVSAGNTSGSVNVGRRRPPSTARRPSACPPRPRPSSRAAPKPIRTPRHFTAYLGDYLAFVTVVTDPGSPNPPLGQDFAAEFAGENGVGITRLSGPCGYIGGDVEPEGDARHRVRRRAGRMRDSDNRPSRTSRTPTSPTSRTSSPASGPAVQGHQRRADGHRSRTARSPDAAARDDVRPRRLREVRQPAGRARQA